jgi:hypothetical protein
MASGRPGKSGWLRRHYHAQGYPDYISVPQPQCRHLADEYGHLSAQVETRKRAIADEVIRRGVSECDGALFRSVLIGKAMVCTLDRAGIEKAIGEAWVARFLKWSKRSVSRQRPAPARPAGSLREGAATSSGPLAHLLRTTTPSSCYSATG